MVTVEVKNSEEVKELEFPKLMKSSNTGIIVLFTDVDSGTTIFTGDDVWGVGHTSSNWNESHFKDFNEELTLKNKQ